MQLKIRTRLTLAYTTVAFVLMAGLGLALYLALYLQLNEAADKELNSRADGVVHLLQWQARSNERDTLPRELREHSDVHTRGDILQVRDATGDILYRSAELQNVVMNTRPGTSFTDLHVRWKTYRVLRREVHLSQDFVIELASDRTEYYEALEDLRLSLLLGIPLTVSLSAFAGFWMSGRTLRPIRDITETVREINGRKLSVRLPLSGSADEIDELCGTMNGMLDRLQHAFDRIGRFTADASHELRTPLTLIRGNTEMIRMGREISAQTESRSVDILMETDRMERLIQGLLDLARNDENIHPEFELVDPADLTTQIAQVGQRLAAEAGVHFTIEPPKQIFPLLGSDLALTRVGVILLDNAIRHTLPGKEVRLAVRSSATDFTMEVSDAGNGIEARHLPHIFDRFYRVDNSRNRATGGAGLGLSIAHSIVLSHGGTISVSSQAGAGSIFTVSIPGRMT